MKFTALVLLICSFLFSGCHTYPTRDDEQRELQAQLKTVAIEGGIGEQDANIIARSYFARYGPGCGAAAKVIDGGEVWISNAYVGFAGIPTREPIRIDKHTGKVTWSDGPTVENPKMILAPMKR